MSSDTFLWIGIILGAIGLILGLAIYTGNELRVRREAQEFFYMEDE